MLIYHMVFGFCLHFLSINCRKSRSRADSPCVAAGFHRLVLPQCLWIRNLFSAVLSTAVRFRPPTFVPSGAPVSADVSPRILIKFIIHHYFLLGFPRYQRSFYLRHQHLNLCVILFPHNNAPLMSSVFLHQGAFCLLSIFTGPVQWSNTSRCFFAQKHKRYTPRTKELFRSQMADCRVGVSGSVKNEASFKYRETVPAYPWAAKASNWLVTSF